MKNDERTRLLHDHPVIGEGVPMMSMSQKPLALNNVVYSGSGSVSGYDGEKKVEVETIVWRVIQVNYQDRYVRVRNGDGCEMTVSFAEGCARLKLYHDFKQFQTALLSQLAEEELKTHNKIAQRQILIEDLRAESKRVGKMKPPKAPVGVEEQDSSFTKVMKDARKFHMERA